MHIKHCQETLIYYISQRNELPSVWKIDETVSRSSVVFEISSHSNSNEEKININKTYKESQKSMLIRNKFPNTASVAKFRRTFDGQTIFCCMLLF